MRSSLDLRIAVVAVALLLSGCEEERRPAPGLAFDAGGHDAGGHDEGDAVTSADLEGPWKSFSKRPCPSDNDLSWESFGAAFVLAQCTGCHGRDRRQGQRQGAPLDVTFDGPASIRPLMDRIWAVAADQNTRMPPVGGPSHTERRRFGQWLACDVPTRSRLSTD